MKSRYLRAAVLFAATHLSAQSSPASIYAESFRQGSTRIVDEHFEIKLTPQDSTFRERVKDSHGADRYVFSIAPQGPEGIPKSQPGR